MRILNFEDGVVSDKDTAIYGSYYNVHHGDSGGWIYKMSVDKRYLDPSNNNNNPLPLTGNKFACSIIKGSDSKELFDQMGNAYRTLSKKISGCEDILMFCRFEKDLQYIEYDLTGMVESFGEGLFLNSFVDGFVKVPGPVLFVYGDFKLSWRGITHDGSRVNKYLKYDYEKQCFDIK